MLIILRSLFEAAQAGANAAAQNQLPGASQTASVVGIIKAATNIGVVGPANVSTVKASVNSVSTSGPAGSTQQSLVSTRVSANANNASTGIGATQQASLAARTSIVGAGGLAGASSLGLAGVRVAIAAATFVDGSAQSASSAVRTTAQASAQFATATQVGFANGAASATANSGPAPANSNAIASASVAAQATHIVAELRQQASAIAPVPSPEPVTLRGRAAQRTIDAIKPSISLTAFAARGRLQAHAPRVLLAGRKSRRRMIA